MLNKLGTNERKIASYETFTEEAVQFWLIELVVCRSKK